MKTPGPSPTVPTPVAEQPRETFHLLNSGWNVDAMNDELDAHPERVITVRTEHLRGGLQGFIAIDESRLDTLPDPDRPIIVLCRFCGNGQTAKFVADGNHRLRRALRNGTGTMKVFVIGPEDEPRYRLQ